MHYGGRPLLSRRLNDWRNRRERGRNGFSLEDTYGFDSYLARVIAGGVERLRADLHGHPARPGPLGEHETPESWERTLSVIEHGFRVYANDDGYPDAHDRREDFRVAMELFAYWFPDLWD